MNSLISVIIPSYNRVHTLKRSLDSVLKQSYRPLEVIVIDDASIDGTQKFLEQYARENCLHDSGNITLISLVNNCNLGIGATRNVGLKRVQGDYIAFIDSDDEWILPEKLELQVDFLRKNSEYGFIATSTYVHDCEFPPNFLGKSDNDNFKKHILFSCAYQTSSWLIKSQLVEKIGYFWDKPREDYEYLLRIGTVTKCACLEEVCNSYIGGVGDSSRHRVKNWLISFYIILKYRDRYPFFLKAVFERLKRGLFYGAKLLLKRKHS